MSILVGKDTRLLVQGITGNEGSFHTERCMEYGTNVVAGVTPGKGGTMHLGVPVFDSVLDAMKETGANASMIFVPPGFAGDAILESADAGLDFITCITEGIPVMDMVRVGRFVEDRPARLIGPNCPGVISPGALCKIGIMPGAIHRDGNVGVVSRSGTLTYEAVAQITEAGMGQSTCVGIGGDPITGTSFVEVLRLFEEDPQTEGVVMIGEIGGSKEQDAAAFIKGHMKKPVVSFIAGGSAPPGRRMGHAGAIITGASGTAEAKQAALRDAGATVIDTPARLGETMARVLGK